MKRHLNTLYITTQGTYLSKEGETIAARVDGEVRLRLPVHTIEGIMCFGNVLCSPFLLGFCAEKGVGISFLTEHGKFLARVQGPVSGNVLLRRTQYRKADDPKDCSKLAKNVLTGKLANCRTVLQRFLRDHGDKIKSPGIKQASMEMTRYIDRLGREDDPDTLRGIEGSAANIYFSVFNELITTQKEDFPFSERNRRPPLDNVNALLSFVYTLITHDVRSALESVGLDPAVGFLHRDRPGRPGLALDLMEEFRPFLGDRLVLSMINLKKVQGNGFIKSDSGAVLMCDETRKEVLVAYQTRKQEEMVHPFLDEKVHLGMLFHIQALLLARTLRGDLDAYPPFIWR